MRNKKKELTGIEKETVNKKVQELTWEDLEQVSGGKDPGNWGPKPPINYGCPFYDYIELDSSGKCTIYSSTNCPYWCGVGYGKLWSCQETCSREIP